MSDDENIQVKMNEKKQPRKRVERSEEAKQAMLKRLEEGRKKAFEVRMQNKAAREKTVLEEKEKTEKVSSYLKNNDIFEKKYSSKFDKLEEMLTGLDNNFKDIKEYKKQKRERQAKDAEEQRPKKEVLEPQTNIIHKEQPNAASITPPSISTMTQDEKIVNMAKGLPNYKTMKFGRANY
ncbi:MAG: hypothetical protein WCI60_01660 [bacterium]